jgi:hypothetical protein
MIRMNRSVGVVLVGAALAATGIGAAVKAAEDHTTTFTFNYQNATIKNLGNLDSPSGSPISGSTNVPNVGPVDLVGKASTYPDVALHGTGTLTVRNNKSDKIFFTWSKGEIDSTGEFELTMTITGGTGNFENAAGTGLVEGTIGKPAKNGTAKLTFLAQGVISF